MNDYTKYGDPSKSPINNAGTPQSEIPEPTQVVTASTAKPKKMGFGTKLLVAFTGERSMKQVGKNIYNNVIVPKSLDLVMNIFSSSVNMIGDAIIGSISQALYGDPNTGKKFNNSGRIIDTSRVQYNSAYPLSQQRQQTLQQINPTYNPNGYANSKVIRIPFNTQSDVTTVVAALNERIELYGACSVNDLYILAGMSSPWANREIGWKDISQATWQMENTDQGMKCFLTMPPYVSLRS